jgi:hypothetical protein
MNKITSFIKVKPKKKEGKKAQEASDVGPLFLVTLSDPYSHLFQSATSEPEAAKPVEEAAKPVEEAAKPVEEASKPVEEVAAAAPAEPVKERYIPFDESDQNGS